MAESPEPRIRHITGIGIHELTLPGPSSSAPFPSAGGSPRARRTSHAGLDVPIGRARAPTLAGEGYLPPVAAPLPTPAILGPAEEEEGRPLVRCFVAFCLPEESEPGPSRAASPTASPPNSAGGRYPRSQPPVVSRSRTTSLPPKPNFTRSASSLRSASPTSPAQIFPVTEGSPVKSRPKINGSPPQAPKVRPPPLRRSTLGFAGRAASDAGGSRQKGPPPPVPFFLSPIHAPSTHPRWAHLEKGDMASWLSVTDAANTQVDVQVWVDEGKATWRRLRDVGGLVDLTKLVPIPPGQTLAPNTLQWTFSSHPKSVFYSPPPGTVLPEKDPEKGILERSVRETRMRKGATVGALHQLVNIQSVITDTQRSIDELQKRIDSLIASDADSAKQKREVSERALRVMWVRDRVAEVEHTIEETKARITLHQGQLSDRRALLAAAVEREETTKAKVGDLSSEITQVESERTDIIPQIHRLRALQAQTIDSIFPIVGINPQSLLYSILDVPLPIPLGPKDPAPPLSLPPTQTPEGCPKVDERTTAAALGYAALVVQLISGLGGAAAGLAYPVTYAGSRSHVRDVVSVMQGPRSFPLYARGIERYRYEYAVFLLNKDIEMLMLEADIRMLDLRHTLPNLKNLLLTLSSPDPPPPGPVSGPGWASGAASLASSRKPSAAWTFPPAHYRSASVVSLSPLIPSNNSASLASASVHSVCPTNDTPSMSAGPSAGASALTSPLPWSRPNVDTGELSDSGTETEGYTVK